MKVSIKIDKSFFNEAYLPYLFNEDRVNVFYGGGGSGKSHFVVQKHIVKALMSKRETLVIRKVQATMRESVYKNFILQLKKFGILKYCKTTTTAMSIELPNGSRFIFMGLDDSEKIKSIESIDDIIIEEATELKREDFSQLNLRLRSNAGNLQMSLMFNPVSKRSWVYEAFFTKPVANLKVVHTTYKDNKFLPDSYRESLEALKETDPLQYEIYALGKFGNLGKRVFENWVESDFDIETLRQEKALSRIIGLDFGFSADPTTIIESYVDKKNKIIYVNQEVYERGLLNSDIAEKVISNGWDSTRIYADNAEPKSIEELKKVWGLNIFAVKKGNGSINTGIQYMKQYRIFINPRCENTILEFTDYSNKKDKQTGGYLNEYVGADHAIDAIRYSMEKLSRQNKVKFLDKSTLGL